MDWENVDPEVQFNRIGGYLGNADGSNVFAVGSWSTTRAECTSYDTANTFQTYSWKGRFFILYNLYCLFLRFRKV